MPISLFELVDIREECLADDIPITINMHEWSADRARAFFEAGGREPDDGQQEPLLSPPLNMDKHIDTYRQQQATEYTAWRPGWHKASIDASIEETERFGYYPRPVDASWSPARPVAKPAAAPKDTVEPPSQSYRVLKLFGDSHVNTFITIESTAGVLIAHPYTAGSAMGLRHADSISGYRRALEFDLRGTQTSDGLVLKFGQVDVDFVYYLKWVDDPSLAFDAFAADSVAKYFSFVDDALKAGDDAPTTGDDALLTAGGATTEGDDALTVGADASTTRRPLRRTQLMIMTPFPTAVSDAHLRTTLCTLPFMDAPFKQRFKEKLHAMRDRLPTLKTRVSYGQAYCRLLREAASVRGLRCIDMYSPLLGPDGLPRVLNTDPNNHHLTDRHIPHLLPALDAAFHATHRRARLPQAMPAHTEQRPLTLTLTRPPPMSAQQEGAATLQWFQLFQSLRNGQVRLKLAGHAVGSFRDVERRVGPPLPMQYSLPKSDEPGFAMWLVRFARVPPPRTAQGTSARGGAGRGGGVRAGGVGRPAVAGSSSASAAWVDVTSGTPAVARILGRYRNYDEPHAWLVEVSAPVVIEAVCELMAAPCAEGGRASRAADYDAPPQAFHDALSGKRR